MFWFLAGLAAASALGAVFLAVERRSEAESGARKSSAEGTMQNQSDISAEAAQRDKAAEEAEVTVRTAREAAAVHTRDAAAASRHLGALLSLQDTEAAIDAYLEAVSLEPGDPDGWFHLGRLQWREGHLSDAERSFERVLALVTEGGSLKAAALESLGRVRQERE